MRFEAKGIPGAVIKGSVLTFALFFLYTTVPILGVPAGILIPLPCIYFSIKWGRITGLAVVLLMLCTMTLIDLRAMFLYLLQSVPCSLLLPEFLLRKKGGAGAVLNTVVAHSLILLAAAVLFGIFVSADIDGLARGFIQGEAAQVREMYRQVGVSGEELAGLETALSQVESLAVRLYPALIVIGIALTAGLNLLVLQRFRASLGRELSLGRLSDFKNPDFVVWILIISGFALLTDNPFIDRVALNLLTVVVFLYVAQGVAVVLWFFRKLALPRFVTVLFCLLLLLQPILAVIAAALGLFDLWADFRTPKKNTNL